MLDRQPEPLAPAFSDDDIEEIQPRDRAVLDAIQQEGLTVFTFDGLRRLLRMHQETLSRAIDRLQDQGLIEKVPGGYRVSDQYEATPMPAGLSTKSTPLVQTLLPPDTSVQAIIAGLKGRWFGNLRWLGYSETDHGTVLKWITDEEGTQLDARFSDSLLTIEAHAPNGREAPDAVNASYELLSHISRLYRRRPPAHSKGMFANVAYHPGLSFA